MNWDEYDKIMVECKELGMLKNSNYGDDSLKLFDGLSVIVRMYDKMERLKNLYTKQLQGEAPNVLNENIEDTLKDMINYANYAIIIGRGKL